MDIVPDPFYSVNVRIPPLPSDVYVTPDYEGMSPEDLSYARAWARKVLRWRKDPANHRVPPDYNPPSQRRGSRGLASHRKIPTPADLGIPPRQSPIHPLRLDQVDPLVWKRLSPAMRTLVAEQEAEVSKQLREDSPARAWAIPPPLPPGPLPTWRRRNASPT